MVACVAEYQSFWFSHSSSIYSVTVCKGAGTRSAIIRWRWPRFTLENDMPSTGKIDKQATSIQTHKYKTDIKDGSWNTQKGQPTLWQYCQLSGGGAMEADTWRTGKSTGDGGEKQVQRPEVRSTPVGSYRVWLVRCRAEGRGGAKEIRPTALAGPKLMWVFRAFTEGKR